MCDSPLTGKRTRTRASFWMTRTIMRVIWATTTRPGRRSSTRVSGINGNAPNFHYDEDNLAFQGTGDNDSDLWKGQVLDLVAVKERSTLIDDGESDQSYLIGLGEGFEVVIGHLDDSGAPDKYAVVDSSVNWNGADEADRIAFGAAFAYDTADGESATLYFAGNDGEGLFQIGLPISVDDDCWNAGDDTTDHAKCDSSSATLTRVADAAKAESNDGMNCPVVWTVAETYAPSPQPIQCSEDEVCWSDMCIQAWDCASAFSLSPVQVMKDGDDLYKAMTLDLETGEYEEMFELEYAVDSEDEPQHVNARRVTRKPLLMIRPRTTPSASSTSSSVGSILSPRFVGTRSSRSRLMPGLSVA